MGGSRRKKRSRTSKKNRLLYRYRLELINGSTRRDSSYVISSSMVSSNWFLASVITRTATIDVHFLSFSFLFLSNYRVKEFFCCVWNVKIAQCDMLRIDCVTNSFLFAWHLEVPSKRHRISFESTRGVASWIWSKSPCPEGLNLTRCFNCVTCRLGNQNVTHKGSRLRANYSVPSGIRLKKHFPKISWMIRMILQYFCF